MKKIKEFLDTKIILTNNLYNNIVLYGGVLSIIINLLVLYIISMGGIK